MPRIMAIGAALGCICFTVAPAGAQQKFGAWETQFGQGVSERSNVNKSGDNFSLACGSFMGGQSPTIRISIDGKDPAPGHTVVYAVDGKPFMATPDENDTFPIRTADDAARIHALQDAMMAGQRLTVVFSETQAKAEFSLRGTRDAFSGEACPAEFASSKTAKHATPQSSALEQLPAVCRERWPDDYVMLKRCSEEQSAALASVFALETSTQNRPTMRHIFSICHTRWITEQPASDYVMKLHCIREQSKAASELLDPK